MKNKIFEIGAWIGVAIILLGYFLLSIGIISGNAAPYHLLMLIGSTFVAIISVKKHAFQPAVLNILFALFATIALLRIAF